MKIFKKKWAWVILAVIILVGFYAFVFKKYENRFFVKSEIKIGWVTDIHADRFKKRDVDSGKLYPKQYKIYLPKVFDAMLSEGIDAVIATGDNTNSGDDNYARDILRIADEKKMDMMWVKGNHDRKRTMDILGRPAGSYYYFRDFENTRIVVLDDTEYEDDKYDYYGYIGPEQYAWIKEALKTDKQIIVAMHIPIFKEDGEFIERYAELEKMFTESGKVKMVLFGHYHKAWQKEYNGIRYYGESALTRDGEEGGYAIINLGNNQVDYKFAK